MINIKKCWFKGIKNRQKSYKNIDIYYIRYITIKNIGDYESAHGVDHLYFVIDKVDGNIKAKKMGINTWFLLLQTYWKNTNKDKKYKTKTYWKNTQNSRIKWKV